MPRLNETLSYDFKVGSARQRNLCRNLCAPSLRGRPSDGPNLRNIPPIKIAGTRLYGVLTVSPEPPLLIVGTRPTDSRSADGEAHPGYAAS